jgi:hypothetical protein
MSDRYTFFESVPQVLADNIEWRLRTREAASVSKALQKQLMAMCSQDFLFWLSGFCLLYEPRPRKDAEGRELPKVFPFIPWEHQIPVIKLIDENIGYKDIALEKARGEGASWISVMFALYWWLFKDRSAIGMVSRTELAADNPEDPDSLMWKIDFQVSHLPPWMVGEKDVDWKRNISKHTLLNLRNNSSITAYSATGDVASGGRKSWFLMDELAKFPRPEDDQAMDSTGPVTDSRLIVSTPKGSDGAYYNIMHKEGAVIKIIVDWKNNPFRNRGLFNIGRNGAKWIVSAVDAAKYGPLDHEWCKDFISKGVKRLADRGFNVSDKKAEWSPWYVEQCLRAGATPKSIAQEYDRDYGGSVSRFFNCGLIDRLIVDVAKNPKFVGDIQYDTANFRKAVFVPNPAGNLFVWCALSGGMRPPRTGGYVMGIDIASGQGGSMSSNSVISVVEKATGVKCAEFASPNTPPEALADYAVALCWVFQDSNNAPAFMIWESNGYGAAFKNRVLQTDFRNFYYRRSHDEITKKPTKKPGFTTQKQTKRELLGQYNYSLCEGMFVNRSKLALAECKEYMLLPGGKIEHVAAVNTDDPAQAGEAHGDRVIADALAWWAIYEQKTGPAVEASVAAAAAPAPPLSLAWFREREAAKGKKGNWW